MICQIRFEMKRHLLTFIAALFLFSFSAQSQDRLSHPISSARIVGIEGKAELIFDEAIEESFTVTVLDLTGKSIFVQQHSSTEGGCSSVEIPVENLRKGIYMVQVVGADGKTKTLKLQRN